MRLRPSGLSIILCNTRHAGNIGATARFMANMGMEDGLILVNPTPRGHLEAMRMAPGAECLIEKAVIEETLAGALAPFHWSMAVTRRLRRIGKTVLTPEEASLKISSLGNTAGALVFGSEKTGLTTEEVSLCGDIISIPSSEETPSLNLAQAVAVVLYQVLKKYGAGQNQAQDKPANHAQRRILHDRIRDVLQASGYMRSDGARQTMMDIEDLFNRASLGQRDLDLLLGMFRRIQRKTGEQD